jgi:hypothetical protein
MFWTLTNGSRKFTLDKLMALYLLGYPETWA